MLSYDREWIRKIESPQHKIGCRILKVRNKASCMGVRGELGWKSLEGEIMHAKLILFGKVVRMPSSRWCQKVLVEAEKQEVRVEWLYTPNATEWG